MKYVSMTFRPKDAKYIYRLAAVIEHTGDLNSGHYISYVRANRIASEEKEISWARANDNEVQESCQESVFKCQPYILFYELVEE